MISPFVTLKSSRKCDQTPGEMHRSDKALYQRYHGVGQSHLKEYHSAEVEQGGKQGKETKLCEGLQTVKLFNC